MTYTPTDEQIKALAEHWIDDWDTRADEHEDWLNDFRDLITSDAGQAIIRSAERAALGRAIQAHRAQHPTYGSTSVCRGGLGGAAMTEHCAATCYNVGAHGKHVAAWEAIEHDYFSEKEPR